MAARRWHGLIAVLVIAALVLQIWIAIQIPAGPAAHGVGELRGTGVAGRLLRVISFFTVQSNVLSAVVSVQLARASDRDGTVWRVLRLAALFGITVTGIVYATVLARVHEPHGWQETSTNTVFHYVVPIMMVLGWAVFGPRPRISLATIRWALVWPILWFGYTLAHGAISGWYPYPFVDVTTHGYGRVLLNAVAVTVVLGAVAGLYAWSDHRLPARPGGYAVSARTTRDGLGRPS